MNAIVSVDRNWAIGKDNGLLFSLPTDMKYFRTLTTGGTLLMGRRTLDSFPGGKPLPNRRNIVITRNPDFQRDGVEVVSDPEDCRALISQLPQEKVWVIGGGSVYTALLPQCHRAYVTRVDAAVGDADTFFPNLDKSPDWKLVSESEPITENGLTFRFVEYSNESL